MPRHSLDGESIAKTLVDAKGDVLVGTAADTVDRLAVGTDGHVLTADSAQSKGIKWAAASGGIAATIVDAKGDLIVATAADTVARKAVGANKRVLRANSAQSDGLEWADTPTLPVGAGLRYIPSIGGMSVVFIAPALDTLYLTPIWLPAGTINLIGTHINGAFAATGVVRVGLYDESAGKPNAPLAQSTAIATTSTGNKSFDPALVIAAAGWYYTAAVFQGSIASGNAAWPNGGQLAGMPQRTYAGSPLSEKGSFAWSQGSITSTMPNPYVPGTSPVTDAILGGGPLVAVGFA